jgi:hypothetical protein
MSDDKPEQEGKRKKRPTIGGISQYATIGSKRGGTEHRDTQTLEHSDVQTSEREDVQDTGSSDVLTSERQGYQASRGLEVQKKPKPDRNRQTVYLEPDLDDWIREHIIRERKRLGHRVEISDIVNEAVRLYASTREPSTTRRASSPPESERRGSAACQNNEKTTAT